MVPVITMNTWFILIPIGIVAFTFRNFLTRIGKSLAESAHSFAEEYNSPYRCEDCDEGGEENVDHDYAQENSKAKTNHKTHAN